MSDDDILHAYQDIAANGTASAMIIRHEEMPGIVSFAALGDEDATMRLYAVSNILPQVETGEHNCVVCSQPVSLPNLAAMVFVSKKIERGADALWCLVCGGCDDPDPATLVPKLMDKLGFKRLHHEAGHA